METLTLYPVTDPVTRAEALFTSDLSTGEPLDPPTVERVIRQSLTAHGGIHGCAAEMAAAYGDHPETAATRMRWALSIADIAESARVDCWPSPAGNGP